MKPIVPLFLFSILESLIRLPSTLALGEVAL